MSDKKSILFLTGTRADFGKIKPLVERVEASPAFECSLFVTGMHTLSRYGYTVDEVYKTLGEHRLSEGFRSVYTFMNQAAGEPMECILANTVQGLSRYVHEFRPDMIVVHGDRVEAMAGAIVGSLRNILVAHIEGGELSGTVDEIIRHAVSKMSHVHFVANEDAAQRLRQLGEREDSIFVIGSPDIDIMLSNSLPDLEAVKRYYQIPYEDYAIVLFHPVTTDPEGNARAAQALVSALIASGRNYVVIYPNNDEGCETIFNEYARVRNNDHFVCFPSLRMEYFLTLMKHADFVVGNSSAGVREAPVYGVHTINIEGRQTRRFAHRSIVNVKGCEAAIAEAIAHIDEVAKCEPNFHFGRGDSADRFMAVLEGSPVWQTPRQKQFVDACVSLAEVLPTPTVSPRTMPD